MIGLLPTLDTSLECLLPIGIGVVGCILISVIGYFWISDIGRHQ